MKQNPDVPVTRPSGALLASALSFRIMTEEGCWVGIGLLESTCGLSKWSSYDNDFSQTIHLEMGLGAPGC
jgi:hypothetical protein